jgi:hypothetical protein
MRLTAMAQTVLHRRFDWEPTQTPYQLWQQDEGIPIYRGAYVPDLYSLELGGWPRLGQRGAFVNLADQEHDDAYVLEVDPGRQTEVIHHFFEATVFVLQGHGATTFWQDPSGRNKQTVEWQRGSMFAPPLNCYYQHFNLDGREPARLFGVTSAPLMINLLRSTDFIFNDRFIFEDRYDGGEGYFSNPGQRYDPRTWQTNFVADIRAYHLDPEPERGEGNSRMGFALANNQMGVHVSEFPPGTYKRGHRHGPGAHLVILDGVGYSLLWFEGEPRERVEWKDGTAISPVEMQYHQHFNTGPEPARYLAITLSGLNTTGGWQQRRASGAEGSERGGIPYDREDPEIYEQYVAECTRNGATVVLPPPRRGARAMEKSTTAD